MILIREARNFSCQILMVKACALLDLSSAHAEELTTSSKGNDLHSHCAFNNALVLAFQGRSFR